MRNNGKASANGSLTKYFKQQHQQLWNVATMCWIKGSDQMYQIDAWQWFQLNWIKCIWKLNWKPCSVHVNRPLNASTKRLLMISSLHIEVRIQSLASRIVYNVLSFIVEKKTIYNFIDKFHFGFWCSVKSNWQITFKCEKLCFFLWNFDNLFQE